MLRPSLSQRNVEDKTCRGRFRPFRATEAHPYRFPVEASSNVLGSKPYLRPANFAPFPLPKESLKSCFEKAFQDLILEID